MIQAAAWAGERGYDAYRGDGFPTCSSSPGSELHRAGGMRQERGRG